MIALTRIKIYAIYRGCQIILCNKKNSQRLNIRFLRNYSAAMHPTRWQPFKVRTLLVYALILHQIRAYDVEKRRYEEHSIVNHVLCESADEQL